MSPKVGDVLLVAWNETVGRGRPVGMEAERAAIVVECRESGLRVHVHVPVQSTPLLQVTLGADLAGQVDSNGFSWRWRTP